jgi:uncharacterized protein
VSTDQELKIVFTGPMGAGKTTAIRAISDIPPVCTEVDNTDRQSHSKESTTVAMDYGQLQLDDGTAVRLYGTPGQQRFSFMWEILCSGAIGVILLVDGSAATVLEDLGNYAETFRQISPNQPFVVGVGRIAHDGGEIDRYTQALADRGIVAPVFGVDVRNREDVLLLIETLLCILEVQATECEHAGP